MNPVVAGRALYFKSLADSVSALDLLRPLQASKKRAQKISHCEVVVPILSVPILRQHAQKIASA